MANTYQPHRILTKGFVRIRVASIVGLLDWLLVFYDRNRLITAAGVRVIDGVIPLNNIIGLGVLITELGICVRRHLWGVEWIDISRRRGFYRCSAEFHNDLSFHRATA